MKIQYRVRALADIEEIYAYISPLSPAGAHNVILAIFVRSRLLPNTRSRH
jgi:hypothetical protein